MKLLAAGAKVGREPRGVDGRLQVILHGRTKNEMGDFVLHLGWPANDFP